MPYLTLARLDLDATLSCFLPLQLKRPPERCVVFSDESRGIIDAHEATCKAVGVLTPGSLGGDLRSSDVRISGFDDLSLMTMRELFKGVPVR